LKCLQKIKDTYFNNIDNGDVDISLVNEIAILNVYLNIMKPIIEDENKRQKIKETKDYMFAWTGEVKGVEMRIMCFNKIDDEQTKCSTN